MGKISEGVSNHIPVKATIFFITMKKLLILPPVILVYLLVQACTDAPTKERQTILTGAARVVVDEGLLPIMEDQLKVFQNSYTNSGLELLGLPERRAVSALLNDTAEIAILTRLLTPDEHAYYEARQFSPRVHQIATDAVALVVHQSSSDSTARVSDLIKIMSGDTSGDIDRLVFDNPNSSTVRYLMELAQVDTLPSTGVYALQSNREVLKYVNENPGTIGVVGINWVIRTDSTTAQYVNNIRLMGVQNIEGQLGSDAFYKPSQSNLAEGLYALARPVYIINAEPRAGLGMGFAAFLTGERGQRIILRSGLMPDSLPGRELILRTGRAN